MGAGQSGLEVRRRSKKRQSSRRESQSSIRIPSKNPSQSESQSSRRIPWRNPSQSSRRESQSESQSSRRIHSRNPSQSSIRESQSESQSQQQNLEVVYCSNLYMYGFADNLTLDTSSYPYCSTIRFNRSDAKFFQELEVDKYDVCNDGRIVFMVDGSKCTLCIPDKYINNVFEKNISQPGVYNEQGENLCGDNLLARPWKYIYVLGQNGINQWNYIKNDWRSWQEKLKSDRNDDRYDNAVYIHLPKLEKSYGIKVEPDALSE
jgi:hypothetical protein